MGRWPHVNRLYETAQADIAYTCSAGARNQALCATLVTSPPALKYFGQAYMKCVFFQEGGATRVTAELESEKNPKGIRWLFVKLLVFILRMQSRSAERRFIEHIERTA